MEIDIAYRAPWRLWHARLAGELESAGHDVRIVRDPGPGTIARGASLALNVQQRLFGPSRSLFDPAEPPVGSPTRRPALVLALDGARPEGDRYVDLTFAGAVGDAALVSAIATGRAVPLAIRGPQGVLVEALLAVEQDIVTRALDQVLARLITLVLQAVRRFRAGSFGGGNETAVRVATRMPGAPTSAVLVNTARKIGRRLPGLRQSQNHWRVGYRIDEGGGLARAGELAWRQPSFRIVSGPLDHFYADPIPVACDGRRWIFIEDYPYATRKGVIALIEIMPDGSASAPRTVLERDVHLSYPLILVHEGTRYMLPEMGAGRRIQLFRADPFPDRWVPDRILVDDIVASDATPIFHAGRWWMFATVATDGGSTWDALHLFHAPDLFGPWTAHAGNPVLVDAGAARPAGPMWHEAGALMRVVQDCRDGYGRGLAVFRVDRLDEDGFAQTLVSRLGPPDTPGADGVHTLARDGDLEVIDIRFRRRESLRPAPGRG